MLDGADQQPDGGGYEPGSIQAALGEMPDRPIKSTRGRGWPGLTADCYAAFDYHEVSTPERNHHVVCIMLSGTARLRQHRFGQTHTAVFPPSSVILIPAGVATCSDGRTAPSLRLRVSPALLAEAALHLEMQSAECGELRNVFHATDRALERYAAILHQELGAPSHSAQALIIESLSSAIVAHLLRSYDPNQPRPRATTPTLEPNAVALVSSYIDEHIGANIRLDDLSKLSGISRFQFSRAFKTSTGLSPMAFVERARLNHATDLIRRGDLSLAEIAAAVGFSDQSHFTRRFLRHTGVTPGALMRERKVRILGSSTKVPAMQ